MVERCLLMLLTLFGITLVTFLLMDLAPVDRAQIELATAQKDMTFQDRQSRELALVRLRMRYGLLDPRTGEEYSVLERYAHWLGKAAPFRLAGRDEHQETCRGRITGGLSVSLLIGFWALVATAALGVPLGVWLGLNAGRQSERAASGALFALVGMPEFLLATVLLL